MPSIPRNPRVCPNGADRHGDRVPCTALLAAIFTVMSVAHPLAAQTVRGLVFDAETNQPVSLATVSLLSSSGERVASMLTDDAGFFSLDAEDDGSFLLRTVSIGYRVARSGPFELYDDGLRVIEVRLEPAPLDIEGVVVEGTADDRVGNRLTRSGFWERYEEGRGQFILPGEVAASEAVFTPELLLHLDHVEVNYHEAPWDRWVRLRSAMGAGTCEPRVYVDGRWVNRPEFGIREAVGLDEVVPIDLIQAVEVYWGPFQAPLRYQGSVTENACGVVLFWTL